MNSILEAMKNRKELFWINSTFESTSTGFDKLSLNIEDIMDAEKRLQRFRPFIEKAFPETKANNGLIESELIDIHKTTQMFQIKEQKYYPGKYFLKADSQLPVSGSVKARGGIYEILHHAENLAIENNMLKEDDDYSILLNDSFKKFFSQYKIAVGSTGNLGLSIGIIGSVLNFNVTVHMSADAKTWKKELLRSKGVTVKEYEDDYSVAVREGRKQADNDSKTYFVDDENSEILFLGYATAALRLKSQLEEKKIIVDSRHPLMVYLPCGVGGAPGGITFGLKKIFGDNVHIFFAEPTESPCMFLGVFTGKHENISVKDIGLTNITEADGLAVGRPSGFVGKTVGHLINGFYTLNDNHLYPYLKDIYLMDHIKIEPSAAISLAGPRILLANDYFELKNINPYKATHVSWATGGNMVPDEEFKKWLESNF
ncbi:MAG: D-serine ammonia-lyase [Clostridiales bacterium]|nr:D-serine ammonia-lyase [Clostridiales bacterium]